MRISDWSSDVCSSDLASLGHVTDTATVAVQALRQFHVLQAGDLLIEPVLRPGAAGNRRIGVVAEEAFLRKAGLIGEVLRSEEHTSELQSLMRISYAVFCLKKKKHIT